MGRPIDALMDGAVLTLILVWRLDDPDVESDGRFWIEVPAGASGAVGREPGAIVPRGKALAAWRADAVDGIVEVTNPFTGEAESLSILRWADADPDRAHLAVQFLHRTEPRPPDAAPDRPAGAIPRLADAATTDAQNELSRLRARFRAASQLGDEAEAVRVGQAIDAATDELSRVDFPNHHRGWDLDRATPAATNQLVLDWATGY
jgi:hypothetical protein